jgi:hypothetical protein
VPKSLRDRFDNVGVVAEIESIRATLSTTMDDLGEEDFRAELSELAESE